MKLNSVCRRGLSLLLAIVLMLSMCVQTAQAAELGDLIVRTDWSATYSWDKNTTGLISDAEMHPKPLMMPLKAGRAVPHLRWRLSISPMPL